MSEGHDSGGLEVDGTGQYGVQGQARSVELPGSSIRILERSKNGIVSYKPKNLKAS
jgi:hypothetical protein